MNYCMSGKKKDGKSDNNRSVGDFNGKNVLWKF